MAPRFARVAHRAVDDLIRIVHRSRIKFGLTTSLRYQLLLQQAIKDLISNPHRAGSQARFEIQDGLYFYHIKAQ